MDKICLPSYHDTPTPLCTHKLSQTLKCTHMHWHTHNNTHTVCHDSGTQVLKNPASLTETPTDQQLFPLDPSWGRKREEPKGLFRHDMIQTMLAMGFNAIPGRPSRIARRCAWCSEILSWCLSLCLKSPENQTMQPMVTAVWPRVTTVRCSETMKGTKGTSKHFYCSVLLFGCSQASSIIPKGQQGATPLVSQSNIIICKYIRKWLYSLFCVSLINKVIY